MKLFKIKIAKVRSEISWYNMFIGKEYIVCQDEDHDDYWQCVNIMARYIKKIDSEVIGEASWDDVELERKRFAGEKNTINENEGENEGENENV